MNFKKLLERFQGKEKYEGSERRKHARLVYPPERRPRLKVREHEMEVIEISEEGMRFLNYPQKKVGEKIAGTVMLISGKSQEVVGKIVWHYEKELGLLMTRIPRDLIMEEIRVLLRKPG
ncbi:MAG: PilZ domain-containing protein [Pseudomonadota bacterium]